MPGTPFVTILTDIAEYPPHFWIERQNQYVVCGSGRAEAQAIEMGIARDKCLRTSGMVVHPRFYEPLRVDRGLERTRLGLDPNRLTGLVLFGGEGSPEIADVARRLNRPESGVQLIVLCGRHEVVRRDVEAICRSIPMFVDGFTGRAPYYTEVPDFFIGKPGPGSGSSSRTSAS